MKRLFFTIAVIGFWVSLIVHAFSIFGFVWMEAVPFIWLLFLGVFLVWIPAVQTQNKRKKELEITQPFRKREIPFSKLLPHTPKYFLVVAYIISLYALLNFIVFMLNAPDGTPDIRQGRYVLVYKSGPAKSITKQEYEHLKNQEIRFFSGHVMLFYIWAAAYLYPPRKKSKPRI